MNQKIIAGIGNVYPDEILFQARIHPRTPVKCLERYGPPQGIRPNGPYGSYERIPY